MAQLLNPIKLHDGRFASRAPRIPHASRHSMQPVAAARLAQTQSPWIALAIAGLCPIDNPDTFGHLALGWQIAQHGRVPALDSFSYFQGVPTPYVNNEWLSDRLFFPLYRAGVERTPRPEASPGSRADVLARADS